jgi:hypothetical protein
MTQHGAPAGKYDLAEDIDAIEYDFDQGLTDGLPAPPTEARVARILQGAMRSAGAYYWNSKGETSV